MLGLVLCEVEVAAVFEGGSGRCAWRVEMQAADVVEIEGTRLRIERGVVLEVCSAPPVQVDLVVCDALDRAGIDRIVEVRSGRRVSGQFIARSRSMSIPFAKRIGIFSPIGSRWPRADGRRGSFK